MTQTLGIGKHEGSAWGGLQGLDIVGGLASDKKKRTSSMRPPEILTEIFPAPVKVQRWSFGVAAIDYLGAGGKGWLFSQRWSQVNGLAAPAPKMDISYPSLGLAF